MDQLSEVKTSSGITSRNSFRTVRVFNYIFRKLMPGSYDKLSYDSNQITLCDQVIATIEYEDKSDFPIFKFEERYRELNQRQYKYRSEVLQTIFGQPQLLLDFSNHFSYLGAIECQGEFSSITYRMEFYFDKEQYLIITVRAPKNVKGSSVEVSSMNFYRTSRTSSEEEVKRRAWALIKTMEIESDE